MYGEPLSVENELRGPREVVWVTDFDDIPPANVRVLIFFSTTPTQSRDTSFLF